MSLDKSRIPKRGNSSRKFIPEKQRKTMTDPFVDWIKRTRSDKEGTVSGRMVETRSQKTSEERRELLEVEVNTDHTMNDNQGVNGLEGRGRRLASESTPVEQGHDFATSTGTLDREEMSELSDISTEVTATRRSPTDNTMMASGTGKQTTSSSFSERMKNTFGNIFPLSMGGGAGNDGESQEEEDEEEKGDFGSQVSLNSSIQESEAHVGRETGTMDKFGVVTTISKEANTPGQSKDFAIRTSSEPQPEESRTRGLGNALADPEIDNDKTSRQRVKARISTSTKLPGTDRVTPPLVTPLMDNGAALEEALNNIVGSLGEQNEQMSIRMSELERAVHIERESLREEINRNRQEVGRSEKRLKERTDEHMTRNLSRMTREAEQRELRLRADMEKLRIQQEQSLGSLDTKIDAMMERRTQAIMDRLDGLLSSKSGPKEGEPNSGGPSREPRVNFNEHQRRRTNGSTRGRGSSSGYATRGNTAWGPNSRASSTGNRQTSNERPTQSTHATGRSDSGNMGHTSPRRSHMGQAGNAHGDSDCRDAPHTRRTENCSSSNSEVEFDDEQQQSNEQDLTNLRVLEWLNEMTSDPEKTSVTIQDVDRESAKYIKTERDDPSWAAQEGQLLIPASNLDLIPGMRSTGTPMDIFVRGVGVGLTHTENLIIKKLRIARETGNLEAETGEEPKKPDIGRVVESYFNLPNEYSSNIVLTDSDFILTNRTCAIAITADMSFRTALAADFKREYKNVEFLWKQRPGIGGVAALPPAVSQIPGKYLCFLVTRATEKQHVDPENLVLSLTRLRDFLVEMDVKELSLPVYDPNRGRLHPRELYALVHVIFSDTNIQVYLHKKYYLSIG